jgi:hypothetical protein
MDRRRVPTAFRFDPSTLAVIDAISAAREGLTRTRVIENAVAAYGKKVLGRRMADLVAPKVRPGRRRTT